MIAHNNYVIGHANKIYRLKESGLYGFDVNQEYSDPDARYITLEKYPQREGNEFTLLTLVHIANALDRHVVVPEMPCSISVSPPCNLCGYQPFDCMRKPLAEAKLSWKEHVFFNNQFVPDDVKLSYVTTPIAYFVHSEEKCARYLENSKVSARCVFYESGSMDADKLRSLFSPYDNEKVIRIQRLPDDLYVFHVCCEEK